MASISGYRYYIDFEKVVRNVEDIKIELNILNTLIGSVNIEDDFEKIITKYPETLFCIPLLLAVRSNEIYAQEADTIEGFSFVWFTDGIGWKSAKGNLRETFEAMEHVYNIDDMEHSVMTELLV